MYSQTGETEGNEYKDTNNVYDVMKNSVVDNDKIDELRMLIKVESF